jgi:hypothetical protein
LCNREYTQLKDGPAKARATGEKLLLRRVLLDRSNCGENKL